MYVMQNATSTYVLNVIIIGVSLSKPEVYECSVILLATLMDSYYFSYLILFMPAQAHPSDDYHLFS